MWWADINIYNLNLVTRTDIFTNAASVVLSAGYQDGSNYGIIFNGTIFQITWTREGVVDNKLTLHCVAGMSYLTENMVSIQATAGLSQRDIVIQMMTNAETSIPYSSVDSKTLGTKKLPRGEVIFGSPQKYLNEVASGNGLQVFFGNNGVVMGDITPTTSTPLYTYASVPDPSSSLKRKTTVNYTIIDTPRQTNEGVSMRVLLDARLQVIAPAMNIAIVDTVIQQLLAQPTQSISNNNIYPILSQDGVYAVAGVHHHGDTRENDWYSDVTCITNVGGILSALGETNSLR
jgi:hypothetical protein